MKKVKICGLYRAQDVEAVNKYKPDYAGFIIDFPKSHRNVNVNLLEELTGSLDDEITPVGVFVDEPIRSVARLINNGIISIAQLHGTEDNTYIDKLRQEVPRETIIWQAFQIRSIEDVNKANGSEADFVILDAGQGSGKTFNWEMLKGINREYGLAGGIDISNIEKASETTASLLDISGGVETDKVKDKDKIKAVIEYIKK